MQVIDLVTGYQKLKDKYNQFAGETEGRINSGYASELPADQFRAYAQALGADKVRLNNDSVEVNRGTAQKPQWAEPDAGIDVRDFTTDMEPQLPSMVGGTLGALGGLQGAVQGATLGDLGRQEIGKQKGLRSGYSEGEAKMAGAGELLGPLLAQVPMPNVAAMTAYHGSPHIFDKFDMSKIGTGEGIQGYGRGLYFAEDPNEAMRYAGKRKGSGALYTVDIPDEHIDRMLDWDKPLSEQSEHVKNILGNAGFDVSDKGYGNSLDMAAEKLAKSKSEYSIKKNDAAYDSMQKAEQEYRDMLLSQKDNLRGENAVEQIAKDPKEASRILNELGITGVKYLDYKSIARGEGTRNFVLFDDSIPKILGRE